MDTWIAQAPVFVTALAVLVGFGALLVAPFRVGRLALFALAPLASIAVLGVLAIVVGWIGAPWNVPSILLGCAVFVVVTWSARFIIGAPKRTVAARMSGYWVLISGLLVGMTVSALRVGFYIGDAHAISQTNDSVFHLNALRFALESGAASSFDISAVIGSDAFYPGAWHSTVLAVAQLSGASLPASINVVSVAIATVIWVPGVAWLTWEAVSKVNGARSMIAAGFAAALAPSLVAFPLLMLQWGVLYPTVLSVAMVPAASALVIVAPAWVRGEGMALRRARVVVVVIMFAAAAVAIGLAQPASLLVWLLLAVSKLTWLALNRIPRGDGRVRIAASAQLVALWGIGTIVWVAVVRTGPTVHWSPFETELEALSDVVTNSFVDLPAQLALSVLMLGGLFVAVRVRELRWLATGWLGLAVLYIVVASIDRAVIREYLVGPWYGDPYRIAALMPLVVVPLAAIALTWGTVAVAERFLRVEHREWIAGGVVAVIAAASGVLLAVVPVTQLPLVTEGIIDAQSRYAIDDATYLSTDERELLERLPETLPPGARVIGNPSTGMAFAFALSGVDATPKTWSPPGGEEWDILAEHLRDVSVVSDVCGALEAFGDPGYVLDFGPGETTAGRFKMPGFTDFAGQPGFEMVDSEGDASVWRIEAC